jgi:hypothetical protein
LSDKSNIHKIPFVFPKGTLSEMRLEKTPTIADEGFNSLPVVIANSGKA